MPMDQGNPVMPGNQASRGKGCHMGPIAFHIILPRDFSIRSSLYMQTEILGTRILTLVLFFILMILTNS